MPEQQTTPTRESQPRTDWDIGKAMNGLFTPANAVQDLDTSRAPDEDKATDDEELEDAVASADEDADPEAEGTSATEPFMVLKVDGKDIVLSSREEAIPLAQKGMHYTQEMQKLREREAQLSSERDQMTTGLRQQVDQYQTALKTLHSTYGYVLGEAAPDWAGEQMQALKAERPQEYLALREQWDQLGAIRSEISRIEQDKQRDEQKKWQSWVAREQAALSDKRPEWADATKRQQDWGLIRDYATSNGIAEQEISNLYDHRFWLILHDAARYKQAEAAGKTKREAATTRTAEPGSGKGVNQGSRQFRQERDRLKQTGDLRAAGNIFQELMTKPRK